MPLLLHCVKIHSKLLLRKDPAFCLISGVKLFIFSLLSCLVIETVFDHRNQIFITDASVSAIKK